MWDGRWARELNQSHTVTAKNGLAQNASSSGDLGRLVCLKKFPLH